MTTLNFTETIHYQDDPAGITISVALWSGEKFFRTKAKVDPGAEVCLFENEIGLKLGLKVEQGESIILNTLAGSLEAFGHEVTFQTGELIFQSTVYFAKYPNLGRNILGRRGWTRNIMLAIVDNDNLLYLSAYDE